MKFSPTSQVKWPVAVSVPADGGTVVPMTFTATLVVMPHEEALAGGTDRSVLDKILVGWEGIEDEAGNPLPFTAENSAAVCGLTYIRLAIFNAWHEACSGLARAKN